MLEQEEPRGGGASGGTKVKKIGHENIWNGLWILEEALCFAKECVGCGDWEGGGGAEVTVLLD